MITLFHWLPEFKFQKSTNKPDIDAYSENLENLIKSYYEWVWHLLKFPHWQILVLVKSNPECLSLPAPLTSIRRGYYVHPGRIEHLNRQVLCLQITNILKSLFMKSNFKICPNPFVVVG